MFHNLHFLDYVAILYVIAASSVWTLAILTTVSRSVARLMELKSWSDFFACLTVGIVPILNWIMVGCIVYAFLSGLRISTPNTWKDDE